jgi:hypothetical protein
MDVNRFREALHKQPFEPFLFRLVDGRQRAVPHPDFVAVSTRRVLVIRPLDESVTWLEPLLIDSINYAGAGQGVPPSGNSS